MPDEVTLPKHDPVLAKELVSLLTSASMAKVNFTYKVMITPAQFRRVAQKILDGKMIVGYESGRGLAAYDPPTNCFKLADQNLCNLRVMGNLVHEATHAVCDLYEMEMLTADAELVAYVAQCMWLRVNSYLHQGNEWGDTDDGRLITAAFAIADLVLAGKTKEAFNHTNVQNMVTALGPKYEGLNDDKKWTKFDGI